VSDSLSCPARRARLALHAYGLLADDETGILLLTSTGLGDTGFLCRCLGVWASSGRRTGWTGWAAKRTEDSARWRGDYGNGGLEGRRKTKHG
jgi:hypothetical protein